MLNYLEQRVNKLEKLNTLIGQQPKVCVMRQFNVKVL